MSRKRSHKKAVSSKKSIRLLRNKYIFIIAGIAVLFLLGGVKMLNKGDQINTNYNSAATKNSPNTDTQAITPYNTTTNPDQLMTPTPTFTPTPTEIVTHEFQVSSISPIYLSMNYAEDGKGKLVLNGDGFEGPMYIELLGPYTSDGGVIGTTNGETKSFKVSNVVVESPTRATGTINPGLPNGYFKVYVTNGNAKYSQNFYILRGGDPNEH